MPRGRNLTLVQARSKVIYVFFFLGKKDKIVIVKRNKQASCLFVFLELCSLRGIQLFRPGLSASRKAPVIEYEIDYKISVTPPRATLEWDTCGNPVQGRQLLAPSGSL